MEPTIRIVIADDHQVFIDGLKAILKEFEGLEVIGHAGNGEQLLQQVALHKPDVVLTDIQMPVMNGVEAAKEIQEKFPTVKVIALTMLNESLYIKKMLGAGVFAYVLKTVDKEELAYTIKKVAKGEKHFKPEITALLIDSFSDKTLSNNPAEILTKREKEIVVMISQGLTDKEIADKIHLSPLTIITHRKNILHKLGLKNKVELTRYAFSNNLIS
jgi:DNA-binding NarL/FixJ family response regulator